MTPFTDEDLKRLKEHLDKTDVTLYQEVNSRILRPLVARLEAAEAILENGVSLTHDEDCDKLEHRDLECTCSSEKRWNVWREACGK